MLVFTIVILQSMRKITKYLPVFCLCLFIYGFAGMLTSCTRNSCQAVICANGGACNGGACTCASGYIGDRCQTRATRQYIGSWSVSQTGGYGAAQYPVAV